MTTPGPTPGQAEPGLTLDLAPAAGAAASPFTQIGIGVGNRAPRSATAARAAVDTTNFGRPPDARAGG